MNLPKAFVALDIAHAAERVGDGTGVDVRDAEIVPADVEFAVAVGYVEMSIHGNAILVQLFGGLLR